jgi:hypothetical protein
MNKCVYLLIDNSATVRYVGQGSKTRPYSSSKRSEEYLKLLRNGGYVQIVAENLSRKEALALEKQFLHLHRNTVINVKNSPRINQLNFNELNEVFELADTSPSGLIWKVDRYNASQTLCAQKGSRAGCFTGITGWVVPFKGRNLKVHRIIWVLRTKEDLLDSDQVINHIDGNPENNKIDNLEICSQRDNCLRRTKHSKNTTGISGIKLEINKKRSPSYRVSISTKDGKRINKNFAISIHGLLPAFAKAVSWRENKIQELLEEGNY